MSQLKLFLIVAGFFFTSLAAMLIWAFATTPPQPTPSPTQVFTPSESYNQQTAAKLQTLLEQTEALGVRTAGDVRVAAESPGWKSRMLAQVATVIATEDDIWTMASPYADYAPYADAMSSAEKCAFGAARLRAYFNYRDDPEELRMMERHLRDCFRLVPQVIDRLQ